MTSPMLTDKAVSAARMAAIKATPLGRVIPYYSAETEAFAAFLAAQDRDVLASVVGQAWQGDQYVGDLSAAAWKRVYRVVDALLGTP